MNLEFCPLTGLQVHNLKNNRESFYYDVFVDRKTTHRFHFCENCFEKFDFKKNKGLILGILMNHVRTTNPIIHWERNPSVSDGKAIYIKELLDTAPIPRSSNEKLNYLLRFLYERNERHIYSAPINFTIWGGNYMGSITEYRTFLDELVNQQLLKINEFNASTGIFSYMVTFKALQYFENISLAETKSNKCFIAMSFDKSTEKIKTAIVEAISESGYQPIIISDEHIKSDQTIVDSIIAEIRSCKFCVADFTLHRNGVYFESGFAVGLNKQVIYTCMKDEFEKAHFDIKQLQHIIYENPLDLKEALKKKINAWIKKSI